VTLIAVTGYGQSRDRKATARAGFAAHLVKPVDVSVLKTFLASVEG
jgi:CheY-like chemotaxis protein